MTPTTSTTATALGEWSLPPALEPKELTREALLPYWEDPTVSVERIAMLFGVTLWTVRSKKAAWGLPERKYRQWRNRLSIPREALEPLWRDPEVSVRSITVTLGAPDHVILALASEYGLGEKPRFVPKLKPPPTDKETLRGYWTSEDMTIVQIAKALGCSEKTVRAWAKKWGFEPRLVAADDPTEEEIYARAAELRKDWPASRFR